MPRPYRRTSPSLLFPQSAPLPWVQVLISALRVPLELASFTAPYRVLPMVVKPPGIRRRV